MGKRHAELIKAPCDRILVHAGKIREVTIGKMDRRYDISKCTDLIGRSLKVDLPVDTRDVEKTVCITKVNPYNAVCVYTVGSGDDIKTLTTCLSIADLVTNGLLTFKHGYPEVIKNE